MRLARWQLLFSLLPVLLQQRLAGIIYSEVIQDGARGGRRLEDAQHLQTLPVRDLHSPTSMLRTHMDVKLSL